MKASSNPTGKDPSKSERLQLGGITPRMAIGKNFTDDMECHAPQVLLQLKAIKLTHYFLTWLFSP